MKRTILPFLLLFSLSQISMSQSFQQLKLGFGRARLVQFSPNSDLIAFSVGKKIKLFRSGIQIASFEGRNRVTSLDFDSQAKLIAAGYSNGDMTIWDYRSKESRLDFKAAKAPIYHCEFLEINQNQIFDKMTFFITNFFYF